ncbi:DoxX family membrane protein [Actinomyces oricola]
MDLLRAVARPMLASSFVVDGVDAIVRPRRHVEKFEKVAPLLERAGLPPVLASDAVLLTRLTGAMSVAAGLGLATGRAPRTCAVVLATLNLPLTVVNYPVWAARGKTERREAVSGLARGGAVGAGLLLAAVDREGRPSLAWRLRARKQQRAAIAAAQAAVLERHGLAD